MKLMELTQRIVIVSMLVLFVPVSFASSHVQELELDFSTTPTTNNGEKWRVSYYQGGEYTGYDVQFNSLIQGLMDLGWIEYSELAKLKIKNTQALWSWLSSQAKSDYLSFSEQNYFSAEWKSAHRDKIKAALISELGSDEPKVDLVIAMGTWAGKDIATAEHSVPTVVLSTSDPISSGIVSEAADSGLDHVHVHNDPQRYHRQLRFFHNIVGFNTLGVAFENTVEGRSYSAIADINKIADEYGFKVETCFTQSDIADQVLAGQSVVDCFEKLSTKVDAIYVTVQGGVNKTTTPQLVSIANKHRIPTFSQDSLNEIRLGYLLTLAPFESLPVGRFLAQTVAKIFHGAKPRQLPQIFEEPKSIVINLKTAELIGLYVSADLIAAADKIYWTIEEPE